MHGGRTRTLLVAGAILSLVGALVLLWHREPAPSLAPLGPALPTTVGARWSLPAAEPPSGPVPLLPSPGAVPCDAYIDVFEPDRVEGQPSTPAATSPVHGRVIDHAGAGVASVTVQLYRGHEQHRAETDAEGRFLFAELEHGVYRAYVDAASLPAGMRLLPAWKRQVGPRPALEDKSGKYGASVRLDGDGAPDVELRVFAAGSVRGRLVDAQRKPIVNAVIRLQAAEGIDDATRTDAAGDFVLDEAHPGKHALSVDLSRVSAGAASSPLPRYFDLAPGETHELGELVAGVGGHALRGTVVDPAGRPIAGLGVLCQEADDALYRLRWSVDTDADGRFEIGRLPSTVVLVSMGADDAERPAEERLLAESIAPIRLDLSSAPETLELGPIQAQARHPCQVRGRVLIDTGWATLNGTSWTPRVEIRAGDHATIVPLDAERQWEHETHLVDSKAVSTFAWACATPHPEVEFRAVLTTGDGTELERLATLRPAADATQEVTLSFP